MLSLAGGEAWILTDLPKGALGAVWSPDSKRITFLSSTTSEDIEKAQRNKDSAKSKETRKLEVTKDSAAPKQQEPESEHESDVHIISRAVYRSNDAGYLDPKRHDHIWILEVPTTSDELTKPVQLTSGDFDECEVVWSRDNSRIYFLTERIDEPYYDLPTTDIYSVRSGGGSLYTSFDGKRIQGWIQKPPDFDPKKKYPLILNIYGGPHAAYGWVFDHEFQWMAAGGYVVLYLNPRGSTSYGQRLRQHHSVPLSGRRLPRPDDRGGRSPEAWLHRR
jgi:dipeptidyl aminopeptidase/acylaminoacyl peptidase